MGDRVAHVKSFKVRTQSITDQGKTVLARHNNESLLLPWQRKVVGDDGLIENG